MHLRAHGVEARAGCRREILRILLNGGHAHAELIDGVQRLLDQGPLDGVVLRDRRLHGLLALNQLVHAGLEFNNFARHGPGRRGSKQGAAQGSREHGGTKKSIHRVRKVFLLFPAGSTCPGGGKSPHPSRQGLLLRFLRPGSRSR